MQLKKFILKIVYIIQSRPWKALYVNEQRSTQNTQKGKQLYSDDEMMVFFSFFQMLFNAGVKQSYNKKGEGINKLKAKINEHLSSIVYTLYNQQKHGPCLSIL